MLLKVVAGYLLAINGTRCDSLASALDIVAEIDSGFFKFDQQWLASSAKFNLNLGCA